VSPLGNAIVVQGNYEITEGGFLVEWEFESGAEVADPEAKLKVLRPEGSKYKVVGESTLGAREADLG
jgi:hypothetical protein